VWPHKLLDLLGCGGVGCGGVTFVIAKEWVHVLFRDLRTPLLSLFLLFCQLPKYFQFGRRLFVAVNSQLQPCNLPTQNAMQFNFRALISKSIPLCIQ
jgi:hypothetical protein